MEKVEQKRTHDGQKGHRQRKKRKKGHADREQDDGQRMQRGPRPGRDLHAFGKIILIGTGDHDSVAGAMRALIRLEQVQRSDAVPRKRNQKFGAVENEEGDQVGKNDIQTVGLWGFIPHDVYEQ